MNLIIAEDYAALSQKAAKDLVSLTQEKHDPLICVPSGDTPVGLYQELVRMHHSKTIDISPWRFISLDEWLGMNKEDEGSCTYYLSQQLIDPVDSPKENVFLFDGKAADPERECAKMEEFIKQNGGIDIAILGLGLNGHIGMNEPGTSKSQRSHLANIDLQTQQVGQKYFKEAKQLSQGITLGLATLVEAKHILLLANGEKKATVVKRIFEDPVTEMLPASLLRNHPSVSVYLDKTAARLLTQHTANS